MSAIDNLMKEVKEEADKRQGEVIRRLTINYPVGGHVCDFQALTYRLKKLKKKLKKTDKYVAQLASRVKFLWEKLDGGAYLHLIEMLVRRHQNYSNEEVKFLERVATLNEDIGRVEILMRMCVRCDVCIGCKPRTPLRRTEKWQTKKHR